MSFYQLILTAFDITGGVDACCGAGIHDSAGVHHTERRTAVHKHVSDGVGVKHAELGHILQQHASIRQQQHTDDVDEHGAVGTEHGDMGCWVGGVCECDWRDTKHHDVAVRAAVDSCECSEQHADWGADVGHQHGIGTGVFECLFRVLMMHAEREQLPDEQQCCSGICEQQRVAAAVECRVPGMW